MIFSVQVSSPEITLQKRDGKALNLSGVKTGQLLRAKVLDLLPQGGGARLMISGRTIVAKTDLPVTPGMDLFLEVSGTRDALTLKPVVPPQTAPPSQPAGGKMTSLAGLLSRITAQLPDLETIRHPSVAQVLHSLALKSGKRDDMFLPRLLENLGLTFEKKIGYLASGASGKAPDKSALALLAKQDLKAAVLQLLAADPDPSEAKSLKGGASALESLQQLNSQTGESSRFLLPFPVFAGEGFKFGHLLVNTGKDAKKEASNERRVIQVAFLMNMSALGSIRADFSILDKEITGAFMLEDQGTCDYMAALIPELKARLLDVEYTVGNIQCRVAPKRELMPDAIVRSVLAPARSNGLDLVV